MQWETDAVRYTLPRHNSRARKLYNVDTVQHSKVIARNTMQLGKKRNTMHGIILVQYIIIIRCNATVQLL